MDTYITMTAYGVNAEDALTETADKLSALEQIWSVTDSGSDIYAINHGSGQPVSVSEETAFFQTCKVLDPFHILFKDNLLGDFKFVYCTSEQKIVRSKNAINKY